VLTDALDMAAVAPAARSVADRTVGAAAAARAVVASGDVGAGDRPLVLELVSEANIAAGDAAFTLGQAVREQLPGAAVRQVRAGAKVELPADRRIVLAARDSARREWQRVTATEVLRRRPDTIVVELGLPGWLPDGATSTIHTHGAGRVNLEAAAVLLAG
jgi:beta-N-acetylhexosaminidase